jgi:hypothetical protein
MPKIITLEYESPENDAETAVSRLLRDLYEGSEEINFAVFDDVPDGEETNAEIITARGWVRTSF